MSRYIGVLSCIFLATQARALASSSPVFQFQEEPTGMVYIPGGSYLPFFGSQKKDKTQKKGDLKREEVHVAPFWMDVYPVTKRNFLHFLKSHPKWKKSIVKRIFADAPYLASWRDDLSLPAHQSPNSPITEVSWFIAEEYCRSLGKHLPTVDQWEYVSYDQCRGTKEAQARILEWYSHPNRKSTPVVGSAGKNGFGVFDLHGLIWEWTEDFNNAMVTEEARENGTTDNNMFCGNGSVGALDATDYASFMRYAFRSSLKANYTTANLGFRCVAEINP